MSKNLIKISEIAEDYSNIEFKPYLPFSIKKILIDNILKSVVLENEDGLKIIDYSFFELVKQYVLLNHYSNINLTDEKDIVNTYDQLKEKGIIDYVLNKIPQKELDFFEEVLSSEIQQIKEVDNSISSVLNKALNKLVEKIPDNKQLKSLGKSLIKDIDKLDPNKLSYMSSAIGWINGTPKV